MYKSHKKGFTLIELLITCIIIALLTTVATVNYMTAQKRARDNARKTQVNNIATALETYYMVNKNYPGGLLSDCDANCQSKLATTAAQNCAIITTLNITGPVTGLMYYYKPGQNCQSADPETGTALDTTALDKTLNRDWYPNSTDWLPDLAKYIDSSPIDRQYKGSTGSETDFAGNILAAYNSEDPHGSGSQDRTRTYGYIKFAGNHYMVLNRLEAVTPDSEAIGDTSTTGTGNSTTIIIGGVSILASGRNIYYVGK